MQTRNIPHSPCTCGSEGTIHRADCGCHCAEEFLATPTAAYLESRRTFLRHLATGTLALATLPLLSEEASADPF